MHKASTPTVSMPIQISYNLYPPPLSGHTDCKINIVNLIYWFEELCNIDFKNN